MTMNITIKEATYVDPRAGNDKFFRTFAFGSSWVTQYGRNGTIGTFTKIVDATSPEAALDAAMAKFASKVKKGYKPVRAGVVATAMSINADNLTSLDQLAEALPSGVSTAIVSKPVEAVDLGVQKADDMTGAVSSALTRFLGGRPAKSEDMNPTLPMRPMLASVQTEQTVQSAMDDDAWVAQFKYDGDRVVVEVTNGEIRVLNRQGQEKVKNVGKAHLLPFSALHAGRWVLDGEVVGRTLVLFDVAAATDGTGTWVDEQSSFSVRYAALSVIAGILGVPQVAFAPEDEPVVLAPVATTAAEKEQYLVAAVAEKREGIILRHLEGPYDSGRRSTTLIKHKLIKDADVVITALHDTKQSATLAVRGVDWAVLEVGAASTIGKGDVCVGDVWTVTFLYVTDPKHPRLFQPRLVKKRDDKAAVDCTIDQFVDAGTTRKV